MGVYAPQLLLDDINVAMNCRLFGRRSNVEVDSPKHDLRQIYPEPGTDVPS